MPVKTKVEQRKEVLSDLRVSVDYSVTFEDMIAAGHYDYVADITAKHFPIIGSGKEEFECTLFCFDHTILSENVVDRITDADTENLWEPAKIEHLFAFGATHPAEQQRYPIVALGSVGEINGRRCVQYLFGVASTRSLHLTWWWKQWDRYYRFLAVRKVEKS